MSGPDGRSQAATDLDDHFDPERPRYYILDAAGMLPRYEFLNEDQALFDRRWSGDHQVRPRDLDFVTWVGVPPVREKPQLKLGSRRRGKAPLDIYGTTFFSDRFKQLLCDVTGEGDLEMIECAARDLKGQDISPYWWIDIVRILDCVDEERSVLTRQIDNPFSPKDDVDRVRYMDLQDIRFDPTLVGSHHIFRLSLATQFIIIDSLVADQIRSLKLEGIVLTPLQPPTRTDWCDHLNFKNYPYWTNRTPQ